MVEARLDPVYTDAGIEILPVYRDTGRPAEPDPGTYPYTRGIHATMYRGKKWTIRQYAGYASAEETNRRFRLLLARGQTGLSVAFDLPTQLGYDSDHPLARPEVGRVGVAISTLDDMRRLFDGIHLGQVTTSMTINAPAAILLLMYELVAEEQGVDPRTLRGTIQNDILKEYAARGTYIFPPRPSMRLVTDTFAYCREHLPNWNMISISGYHIREAGATAVQEIAFTLANAIAYVQAAIDAGLAVDEFAPRLSFFFGAHNNFFEEIAKFRAARRMWAKIMRERFGAQNPRSLMLRFHTQTCGCTLTAQQPLNNIVRVAYQALSAVLGGTQSLHTNAYDEALGLPTEESATIALRTQQILAEETGVADTADPLGGSYFVEALTDEIERRAWSLLEEIEELGGAVTAIEQGWMQEQIAESAYAWERAVERGDRVIVGVNKYQDDLPVTVPVHRIDDEAVNRQIARVQAYRAAQDAVRVTAALDAVEQAARGTVNLLPVMKEALRAGATLGQICGRLRQVWGEYRPRFA
ncbi:acyl-CoA mutase large subunit family protein [Thermorudis peleae]|uniref:acyl-CoA mutase large subunit family protein n=1 Tax=Thermorudis peleae TaxID=1382356 RepID=UPI000571C6F6|nr:methylmalonyl-CoA mutase family protein [Thermorudis peleae]MBX6752664.1 methylmalonyl-CoA mutase [Thermorudis peleae]